MRGEAESRGDRGRVLAATLAAVVLLAALAAVPAIADFGDFGGSPSERPDPDENPRVKTPDDPDYDRCESDDEEAGDVEPCVSYFSEQFGLFGFAPESARDLTGVRQTKYAEEPPESGNCPQLDEQGRDANRKSGETSPARGDPCAQISGVRADTAWKYWTGDPETVVAILDTGIEWDAEELVEKVHLNTDELPPPQIGGDPLIDDAECDDYLPVDARGEDPHDANDDGAVNVRDYACDERLSITAGDEAADGDTGADALLDASDLIATFSDDLNGDGDPDDDGNGYADDIAGWDFFDDDNDPFDASSCCSAEGHGTGRAEEAARQTDEGVGEAGLCPECQVMPLRVWDTFVVDTNLYSLGVVYATDNGAAVVEGAVGGLLNSQFARRSFAYADSKGVTLTLVSSDINSANHNYPTNYNEAIYVGGSLPDSAPAECGIGSLPGIGGPDFSAPGCAEFFRFLSDRTGEARPPTTQPPTTSFFRNSNLTQYGGKADIVLVGSTGSENTGQASGAAGLLASYGRERFGADDPLTGNEIRQLLTMTAEDVMPENTGIIGLPDKANDGWDPHFGYGRVNLAGAMERIEQGRIPPEAQLDAPDWFAPINVDRVGADGVSIAGRAAAPHGQVGEWEVEYACGQDALDSSFRPVPGASGSGPTDGELGRLPKALLARLADTDVCDGSVRNDAGRPAGRTLGGWPANPYPNPDPDRHAFQIRLTVHSAPDEDNVGVYRKTLFAYRNDGNRPGWPRPIGGDSDADRLVTGSGGETPPRLADLNGDNRLDVVLGDSSGRLNVLGRNGRPLRSFNGGEPVVTRRYSAAAAHDTLGDGAIGEPREPFRAPAIGDLDGDGEPEIVATAGERVYAWHRDGDVVEGFPARVDPTLSAPCEPGVAKPCFEFEDRLITKENHVKRGFLGSPALADLDRDGRLDIVAGSLDQHVYALDFRGRPLASFNGGEPVELTDDRATAGAEIVASPAIANLDGNERDGPEIVLATNEVLDGDFGFPEGAGAIGDALARGGTGASIVYALEADGDLVGPGGDPGGDQWPVELGTLAGDILPLVVPSNDAAVLDADGDGTDEVAVSAATADAKLVDGDGETVTTFSNELTAGAGVADPSIQLNLADYPSVGELMRGTGPSVIKGGISLNGVANLLAVNQNLLFNHSVQAWDPRVPDTAPYRPGYPVATDDFELLSQPAIARVGGSPGARQALVGTGLYQLHAYGPDGREPRGWPKFLGGWVQPTSAVGDVDGDGKLEVAAVTREGWSFVFNTSADACMDGATTTNAEWWTFGHDEFGSHNYGTDARPPARPGEIDATRAGRGQRLSFAASGDDLLCGAPRRYLARGSDELIRSGADFQDARRLEVQLTAMRDGGATQQLVAEGAGTFRYVAIRAEDDAGNVSYVRAQRTAGAGGGDDGPGGDPSGDGDGPGPGGDGPAGDDEGGVPGGGTSDAAGEVDSDLADADADAAAAQGADAGGDLPFTGLGLAALLVAGAALLTAGALTRRRAAR